MTNSHLLGWLTFGSFAFFAGLAWIVSYTHPDIASDPWMRRKTRITALCFLIGGALFGYFAFSVDNGMRVTTLYEVMAEGTLDVKPGSPASVRSLPFRVEHPGVEHELFVSPHSDLIHLPKGAAKITIALAGPNGQVVLPEKTESFEVRYGSTKELPDWGSRTLRFTPKEAGTHTLTITPLSAGIVRIHVLVQDAKKRDGKRIPGY